MSSANLESHRKTKRFRRASKSSFITMNKRLKLAFLFLVAGLLVAGFYRLNPPATAGGTDSASRAAVKNPPTNAGGSDFLRQAADTIEVARTESFTDADFTAHVAQLKKKLPSTDFTIIVEKPFVVIGDEPADAVKEHSIRTVKWAVDKLKQEYFSKDPKEILDIWLFKDAASYERNAKLLFGYKPDTPYGYYSKIHKALVMDISTGGGTLVHEIVHPFIEANFPNCPPWLNEGLGSLYEQSGEVNGRIHGFTNWRLHRLQADIKARQVPSFRKLTDMSVPEFYNFESGLHYAQSRYLLYYLQQKGLLTKFYREFYAHQKTDPTGYQTLRRVLGVNPGIFKFKWELWVMDLTHVSEQ
jgi:hypothetical protein